MKSTETIAGQISQQDKDRWAAEKAAAQKAASEVRADLKKLAEIVWVDGRGFGERLTLNSQEREFLDKQAKGLVGTLVDLDRVISLIASPRLQCEVYSVVRELFWFGANLARFAPPLAASERAQALEEGARRKEEARQRGKASGESRKAKAANGWQKIKTLK